MRKLFGLCFALLVCGLFAVPATAQDSTMWYHNGAEYFFFNINVPPHDGDGAIRCLPSVAFFGDSNGRAAGGPGSGPAHEPLHGPGMDANRFRIESGQAGTVKPLSAPIGASLMEFRQQSSCLPRGTGTAGLLAAAGWTGSLPCAAPWFWIITFTWGTTFGIPTASTGPNRLLYTHAGELSQTNANQNYFVGSGNERNLSGGGYSYFQDGTATNNGTLNGFQLIARQEWYHQATYLDDQLEHGRDPSGTAGPPLDFGTGGKTIRAAGSPYGAGDSSAWYLQDGASTGTNAFTAITLISGSGLSFGALVGPNSLGIPQGRTMDLLADPITGIGLSLPGFLVNITTTHGGTGSTFNAPAGASLGAGIQLPITHQSVNLDFVTGRIEAISNTDAFSAADLPDTSGID